MQMPKANKAYTATLNRLVYRYQVMPNGDELFEIVTPELKILVATTATVHEVVDRLREFSTPVYIAMTNREGVPDAIRATHGTRIGVMDPAGEIIKKFDVGSA
jgi:hypothetical protein